MELLHTIKWYLIERGHVHSKNGMPRGLSVDAVVPDSNFKEEYSSCDDDVQSSHKMMVMCSMAFLIQHASEQLQKRFSSRKKKAFFFFFFCFDHFLLFILSGENTFSINIRKSDFYTL